VRTFIFFLKKIGVKSLLVYNILFSSFF